MFRRIGIKFDKRNVHKNVSNGCDFSDRWAVSVILYVLLTVHLGIIFVNNQLDTQFLIYVYFNSVHVSGSHGPIIRRTIVSIGHLVHVTVCRRPSGMQF